MNEKLTNHIEDILSLSYDNISNYNSCTIPTIYNLILEKKYNIDVNGTDYSVFFNGMKMYLCNNLPYTINQKRDFFIDSLENLVNNKEIYPFLLFVNNRFVKWSCIYIVKNNNYSYLIISDYNDTIDNITSILLPEKIKYTENVTKFNINNTYFVFDSSDYLIDCVENSSEDSFKTYTVIEPTYTENIYYETKRFESENSRIEIIDSEYNILRENILVFFDGLLSTDETDIEHIELNIFKFNKFRQNTIYKIFYNKLSNNTLTNIKNITNKDYIINKILETEDLKWLSEYNKKFNKKHIPHTNYNDNIYSSLEYIHKYNSKLMSDYYKSKSIYSSILYNGKDLLDKQDEYGFIKLYTSLYLNDYETKVIIFKNGELYNNYNYTRYSGNLFTFPVWSIRDNDVIEIIYINNVDNRVFDICCGYESDNEEILSPDIVVENMRLFTTTPHNKHFNIESNDKIQYEIEYNCEVIDKDKGIYKIYPIDPFYYDKQLKLVSTNQFQYTSYVAKEECIDYTLPEHFKFCNSVDNFLVFINGRKIDNSNFKITIIKNTRPFDDISVYVNITLNKGDKLEVFYLPTPIKEVFTKKNINSNGNIIVNKNNIKYGLDKDLYFIFINGKKLNHTQIVDVSDNMLKLVSNVESLQNICILQHIQEDSILSGFFEENDDIFTKNINETNIDTFFTSESNISNTEVDIKENEVYMKSVLRTIIKDYYLRPFINTGDEFIYDFDTDVLEEDSNGNYIINQEDR